MEMGGSKTVRMLTSKAEVQVTVEETPNVHSTWAESTLAEEVTGSSER